MHGSDFSTSGFSDALVILLAAGIVIPAFARLRISPIIGFILIGVLVGPSALGALSGQYPWLNYITISNPEAIEPFAELGIILLLFSIGLELSFRRLWSMRRLVFAVGAAELVVSAALIGLGAISGWATVAAAIALGLALALSSTAIVLPLVGTHGAVGRSALGMLLFEDVALVPIVFALGAMAPVAGGAEVGSLLHHDDARRRCRGGLAARRPARPAAAVRPGGADQEPGAVPRRLPDRRHRRQPGHLGGRLFGDPRRADRRHPHRRDRVSRRGRGHYRADPRAWPRHLPDHRRDERRSRAGGPRIGSRCSPLARVLVVKALVTAVLLRIEGAPLPVAAETGVLMASPSETTLIVLAAAAAAQLIDTDTATFWQIVTAVGLTVTPLLARLGRFAARQFGGHQLAAGWMPRSRRPSPARS